MSAVERAAASEPRFERGHWLLAARVYAEWVAVIAALALACLILTNPFDAIAPVVTLAIGALVAWIVAQDARRFTIADGAAASLAVIALAIRYAAGDTTLVLAVDVLLSGGVLLAFREIYFRRRGFDGLGLGDVKLAAAGGLLVGATTFAWVLLGASVAALGVVATAYLVAAARGRQANPLVTRKLAFGAFLAPALYIAWIVQELPVLWPAGP